MVAFGARLLDAALRSPMYQLLLVPQARRTMVTTAEANGIDWSGARAWIAAQQGTSQATPVSADVAIPEYYRRPFHAYEEGNLCWAAAWEQELAGKAVGARNFPAFGAKGEEAFRGAFDEVLSRRRAALQGPWRGCPRRCGARFPRWPLCATAPLWTRTSRALRQALASLGATVPAGARIVDLGCGTGTSTRRLAAVHPQVLCSPVTGLGMTSRATSERANSEQHTNKPCLQQICQPGREADYSQRDR